MSREYTQDEIRNMFLCHISRMVDYWAREAREPEPINKLEGLAFSFLSMLDGCTELPAFEIIAVPHETDKKYNQERNENWFPVPPPELEKAVTVHGQDMLHELWHEFRERRKTR